MNHCICCLLLLIILAPTVWAAPARLSPLSQDPYVSALMIEADSGKVLFEANADAKVYPASVLKLMGLYIILERIEQGTLDLNEMVQVTVEAAQTGGSQVYLDSREQFSVEDLLYALIIQSANDAAVALATHVAGSKDGFVALMNQKAQELGMNNTQFYSVHGLPPSVGQKPDLTTARDMALLCQALVKRPEALKYTSTKVKGFREDKFIMRTHNRLLNQVAGCDGLKTGYYQAAGFSIAATAQKNGRRIITLVMGSKERKVRDAKALELLGKGLATLPSKAEPSNAQSPLASGVTFATAVPQSNDTATVADATIAAALSGTEEQQEQVPTQQEKAGDEKAGDCGWGKFFIGLATGVLFSLAFFVGTVFLMKRKGGTARSRYKNRI